MAFTASFVQIKLRAAADVCDRPQAEQHFPFRRSAPDTNPPMKRDELRQSRLVTMRVDIGFVQPRSRAWHLRFGGVTIGVGRDQSAHRNCAADPEGRTGVWAVSSWQTFSRELWLMEVFEMICVLQLERSGDPLARRRRTQRLVKNPVRPNTFVPLRPGTGRAPAQRTASGPRCSAFDGGGT